MKNKKLFISDISDGQEVNDLFLVNEIRRAETRAGKPYLTLKIKDRSGDLGGRVWDRADHWLSQCAVGQVVVLSGKAQSYKNILQLKINSLQTVPQEDVDMTLFVPCTAYDIDEMSKELLTMARTVKNEFLKKLLLKFLQDKEFMGHFQKAPAAKFMHHAYLGGLLEHTLHVARLAQQVAGLYPSVDHSLLLAGAILHDVGKVTEFSYDSNIDYSDQGRLMGHMVLGIEMVQARINKIKNFPEETGVMLKHLILSHHGSHEFGSPSLPMLHEAFILNFIDDLDAKINYMERLSGQVKKEGYQWSEYQRNLERFLFLRGHREQEEGEVETKKSTKKEAPRPPTLWDLPVTSK